MGRGASAIIHIDDPRPEPGERAREPPSTADILWLAARRGTHAGLVGA